jgi:hypothetical protein
MEAGDRLDHPELVRGAVGFYWAAALDGESSRRFGIRQALDVKAESGGRAA